MFYHPFNSLLNYKKKLLWFKKTKKKITLTIKKYLKQLYISQKQKKQFKF